MNMQPEFVLVLGLIIVFFADFFAHRNAERKQSLWMLTFFMLLMTLSNCLVHNEPTSAFGGIYVTSDAVNVMKAILTFGTLIVVIMSQSWVATQQRIAGEFYMLMMSTLLGMFMMMSSGSFLMFFLGLEMASVPLACMVAFDRHRRDSAEGAAKYILMATFSSGVMLFGISFIYAATGSLYFDNVANAVGHYAAAFDGMHSPTALLVMGLVFFFAGLGFKLSLVPFHFWTADTYQGAPTPVTGYLSVISKGAAALTLAIILMKALAPMAAYWELMLDVVIVVTITVGNLFAIRQSDLKRFMAFSSISQAGYIMLAVLGNSQMGIAALTYYVLVYVAANLAVFTVINVVEQRSELGRQPAIADLNGFYQTNPKLSFLLTLALFSLAGIPPFAGMFSKFFVFMAAAEQGSFAAYFVVFIALINTVVSLYYYLLIVKAMYITKTDSPLATFRSDEATRIALGVCTVGVALFGVCSCVFDWIAAAAL
jgi:NADH-quinone oxidoreductase subunit N